MGVYLKLHVFCDIYFPVKKCYCMNKTTIGIINSGNQ